MRNARIVVFDVTAGVPQVPGTWQKEDNGWYTLQGGAPGVNAALCVLGSNGAGKFLAIVVSNDLSQLTPLLAIVTRSWGSLAALFADGAAAALAVKTRWPYWRVTGTDNSVPMSNALRLLTTPLPTLTPSVGAPLVDGTMSITSLDALAFPRTIAGWGDDADAATGGP